MHLNEAEKRMLAGKNGKACELAMNILSDLGDLYGAERMIAVSQVHIDMTLYMVDAGVEFAERMADLGGEFAVPAQLNPASMLKLYLEKMVHTSAFDATLFNNTKLVSKCLEKRRRPNPLYMSILVPTFICPMNQISHTDI